MDNKQRWRLGKAVALANQAFDRRSVDAGESSRAGGRQYPDAPRNPIPPPQYGAVNQAQYGPYAPQPGSYQLQSGPNQSYTAPYPAQGGYSQPQPSYTYSQPSGPWSATNPGHQYTGSQTPSQNPQSCPSCIICKYCKDRYTDRLSGNVYYCRAHNLPMTWAVSDQHDCPSKYANQGQPKSFSPPQQASYSSGGYYTQEPTQMQSPGTAGGSSSYFPPAAPSSSGQGEASSYYNGYGTYS